MRAKAKTGQQLTLDAIRGAELRDEGMARVDAAAPPDWKTEAFSAVLATARELEFFTADDVWARGLRRTTECRALGPVMRRAWKAGYIYPTGQYLLTRQPALHRCPRRVWGRV